MLQKLKLFSWILALVVSSGNVLAQNNQTLNRSTPIKNISKMKKVKNPILKGFNPDPSILRVGNDYYIATSTFEWFPGVQIHHSTDLVNWRLLTRPLNRLSQLDMKGNPNSCGVWAPCLSYDNGKFYLIYTDVKTFDGRWKDTHNYLVISDKIDGDWSDPIYMNSSGFDPSLFHDDDGRKWFVNMIVDHRKGKFFGGIVLQEFNEKEQKLVGEIYHIFEGSELGVTEAPHIYKRNGYYYLVTAEGGTEYDHAVSIARSKSITGPYEIHPENPIITSADNPDLYMQKAGHGSLVETQTGEWYMPVLVSRPLTKRGRCTLGRETALQKMVWKSDDWLYLDAPNNQPLTEVPVPDYPEQKWDETPARIEFNSNKLDINFQSPRVPITDDWCSLTSRQGYVRLTGRESLCSTHEQSMIARRQQAHHCEFSTMLEFEPENYQQMSGLVCYYNTKHFHYLYVSYEDEKRTKVLNILSNDYMKFSEPLDGYVDVSAFDKIYLKAEINYAELQFYYSTDNDNWKKIGPVLDASILSDDYACNYNHDYEAAFTGNFFGICCQDLSGQRKYADFKWVEYKEYTP